MQPLKIKVRGIQSPVKPGFLIGRISGGGLGDAQLIPISDGQNPPGGSVVQAFGGGIFIEEVSSLVTLTSGVPANVISTGLLPAGTWDLAGSLIFDPGNVSLSTFTLAIAALSLSPNTIPTPPNGGGYASATGSLSITSLLALTIGPTRFTLSTPSTIWLVAQATFT